MTVVVRNHDEIEPEKLKKRRKDISRRITESRGNYRADSCGKSRSERIAFKALRLKSINFQAIEYKLRVPNLSSFILVARIRDSFRLSRK